MICVTGHRPDKLGGYSPDANKKLYIFALENVIPLVKENTLITGMALGWDIACARACITQNIPFIAAIPFVGQQEAWPTVSKIIYEKILSHAAQKVVVSPGLYSAHKMQIRNEWMVDRSEKVIALWNETPGGTANCVEYAKKKNIEVINLWDKWSEYISK